MVSVVTQRAVVKQEVHSPYSRLTAYRGETVFNGGKDVVQPLTTVAPLAGMEAPGAALESRTRLRRTLLPAAVAVSALALLGGCSKVETSGVPAATSQSVQFKTSWVHGVAGAYNPTTRQITWVSDYNSGAAAVYNPTTQQVETKTAFSSGVAGVYNPDTHKVVWKTAFYRGVAGVYNPETHHLDWQTSPISGGVAGVWNPAKWGARVNSIMN